MNFAIVTCYNSKIEEMMHPLSQNKKEYCDRWGYKFFLKIEDWDVPYKSVGFQKIDYLINLMEENPEIDMFCWMDNDATVMNHTIPLHAFYIPETELLIGEDWNGINVGVFFIKNTKRTKDFLSKVWNYTPPITDTRPYWWCCSEQCAISDLCSTINTMVTHHSLFNGYLTEPRPGNIWNYAGLGPRNPEWKVRSFKSGDFALHFCGEFLDKKQILIKEYMDKTIK